MSKYKILIVEDSQVYQEAYRRMLPATSFTIEFCTGGKCFLDKVFTFLPDAILMDIYLPDANGVDLTRILQQDKKTKDIPVIIITSSDDDESQKSAYQAGAREFIIKPVNEMQLRVRLENVLRLRAQKEELEHMIQDNTVSEMGASIAHHFNQPLTTLLGAVQMLQMRKKEFIEDAEMLDLIDMIFDAGQDLADKVKKVEKLKNYKAKHYLKDINIVDLES